MVSLYAIDIRDVAPDAERLISLVDEERAAHIRAIGVQHDAALRSLAAGLLIRHAFGPVKRLLREQHGRPYLPDKPFFSLSHAGSYAMMVVSPERVGVDLELERTIEWRMLASRFCHADELAYISEATDPKGAFFIIWTLKESYLKAEGLGFSVSPKRFAILPEGANGARIGGSFSGDYFFRRYDDVFMGYRVSVCAREATFSSAVCQLSSEEFSL